MTEMMSGVERVEEPKPEPGLDGLDEQLVEQLVGQARTGGCSSQARAGCCSS
jgi:putative transposase